ncbi:MAG: glycosyltransferase family 4 protein [Acidobacteriaceae bacterium]
MITPLPPDRRTTDTSSGMAAKLRLAYLVSHPIQYQAPLLRRIALEPDIDLTVLFGSDISVRGYKDQGFGVEVAWDTPLLEGYRWEFLRCWRDTGSISETSPVSRGIYRRLSQRDGTAAFDALWVHGYASVNSLLAILAANALGIPVLLRAESWLADRVRHPWKLALKRGFFQMLRPGITAVLPIGTANQAYWTHYFGDRVPQFRMPYAVDNRYFASRAHASLERQEELRSELKLSRGKPVILFASKLQERKHADHLLQAYARFRAERPSHPAGEQPCLVIVGDGAERARLEEMARQLQLEDVRFAGFRNQSELPAFFALASVFVLPSRHEPWGLIVNEAMAAGCPAIVSTDVGCHRDLIRDGVDGWVFPVGDIGALCDALHRVFTSPQSAEMIGINAQRRIQSWSYEEDVQGLRSALACVTGWFRG